MRTTASEFFVRVLIAAAVVVGLLLIWYVFDVILVAFGAAIFALLLWVGAEPFMRWLSLREGVALALSGLLILGVLAGIAFLLGSQLAGQLQDVLQRLDSGAAGVQASLNASELGRFVLSHISGLNFAPTQMIANFLKVSSSIIEEAVISLIIGIYLAAQPRLYRDGFVQLFPLEVHPYVLDRISAVADALRLWLIGQLIQMFLIGTLATGALWIIGVPSPIALGLIAGIGEFVPYVGPIIAAIPAVLVASTNGWQTAIWTVVAYIGINQVEGHLVLPLVQRHLVFIPPGVILLGIVAITSLFGPAAAIFAAPISVVIFVAVKMFYVRDLLKEDTPIPGEASHNGS
ncbi:MAG TPA: AI-2E family transporter [Xanthobacteraceae bacterium]|jgi:predicted PurR-regulated permease PerM|nr:AI-2E family transporter [Xanthobacteraceae bacterium]